MENLTEKEISSLLINAIGVKSRIETIITILQHQSIFKDCLISELLIQMNEANTYLASIRNIVDLSLKA